MIEVKGVEISFDDHVILRDVNFRIKKGESVAFIGPSGQGKSVLVKALAGLIHPSKGEIRFGGMILSTLSATGRAVLMKRVGMLFQKNALFDSLSVYDNVAFPLRETTKSTEAEIDKTVKHFLEAVGLAHAMDLFPDEISGGMQKRLGIARALALSPTVIFYDDPTAGLDPITSRVIMQLIRDLKAELGSTVITITNEMRRAYQVADRIFMVVDGTVIETGNEEQTKNFNDERVQQFITGSLKGPLTREA